jgi:hypothetical protein
VEYVALDYLWEKVVTPLIAEAHDYAPKPVVLLAGAKPTSEAKAPSSEEADWGSRNTNPPASPAPSNSGDEIVSEDEILESELTDDDLSSGTPVGLKVVAADGSKKANTR